jgi:Antitoxin MazE-like
MQIWLPDTRTNEFKRAAHKQSLAVARSRFAREDQAFIGSISNRDQD